MSTYVNINVVMHAQAALYAIQIIYLKKTVDYNAAMWMIVVGNQALVEPSALVQ